MSNRVGAVRTLICSVRFWGEKLMRRIKDTTGNVVGLGKYWIELGIVIFYISFKS